MDPITLGALMGGGSLLQEATTGKQQQARDARLKATAYRMMAYNHGINPDSIDVHQADPIGAGIQGFGSGANLGGKLKVYNAWNHLADATGAAEGGLSSGQSDLQDYVDNQQPWGSSADSDQSWNRQMQKPGNMNMYNPGSNAYRMIG